jgi:phosphoserine aminotransferase
MTRTMNFNPGPSSIPLPVLEEVKEELLDFQGTGMSVLECSHRSPEYDAVHEAAQADLKELLGLDDSYHVIFMGGGASTQFMMLASNLLKEGMVADYLVTGTWSKKAIKEANIIGKAHTAANTEKDGKFTSCPKTADCNFTDGAAYVHLTSNNTIAGTQYHSFPEVNVPLIADMSSDILWRPIDATKFDYIYAGAQKNLGPAGVTVGIIRDDLLAKCKDGLPSMLSYKTFVGKKSLYNTPPAFPIYMVGKTLKWLKKGGGLTAMEKINREKGDLLYGTMEKHSGFFSSPVEKESRSYMNVVFRLPTEELEQQFIAAGKEAGMTGLKGHRSVGGCRVSIYNAIPLEWVKAVAEMMEEFARTRG